MLATYRLYREIKNQMVVLEARDENQDITCGTAFHIGDGLLVTARHNIQNQYALKTQDDQSISIVAEFACSEEDRDIAVIKTDFEPKLLTDESQTVEDSASSEDGAPTNFVPIFDYFAYSKLAELYFLDDVFVFGFPPIPKTTRAELVAVRAQVNAFVKTNHGRDGVFILSSTARGGFSGGPVIDRGRNLIGICIESLRRGESAVENGFTAAICLDPLLDILSENELYPAQNDAQIKDWPRLKQRLYSR